MLIGAASDNYSHFISFGKGALYVIYVDGTLMTTDDIDVHQVTVSFRDMTVYKTYWDVNMQVTVTGNVPGVIPEETSSVESETEIVEDQNDIEPEDIETNLLPYFEQELTLFHWISKI